MASAKGRRRDGRFSIEGIRLHERALRAGAPLEQALVAESLWQDSSVRVQQLLANLQTAACPLITIPDDIMTGLTERRDLGGLLGLITLPTPSNLSQLLAATTNPLLLVAVEVVDPGNVGALLRTGHASGITSFMATGQSDPFHPKAVRVGMGSLFKVPVVWAKYVESLITILQNQGVTMVGTVVKGGTPLPQAQFSERGTAVFTGNEYWGLSEAIQSQMDTLITIPMTTGIDSFSVNAAAAITLYEIRRSR